MSPTLSADAVRLCRIALCPRTHHLSPDELSKLLVELASARAIKKKKALRQIQEAALEGPTPTDKNGRQALAWRIEQMLIGFESEPVIQTVLRAQIAKLDSETDAAFRLPDDVKQAMRHIGEFVGANRYGRGWNRRFGVEHRRNRPDREETKTEAETKSKIELALDQVIAAATPAEAVVLYADVVRSYVDSPKPDHREELQRLGDRLPFCTATIAQPFNRLGSDSRGSTRGYSALEIPLPLLPPTRSAAEIESILTAEFPWLQTAIEAVVLDLLLSMQFKRVGVLTPKLLVGDPGCGKTTFCTRVAELLDQPHQVVNAAGSTSPRLLVGMTRGWSGARPALPAELMAQADRAQCCVVVDELDKEASGDYNGRFSDAVLNFLEPTTSSRYYDECLLARCDFSGVNWLCTSNDIRRVSPPLRSRLQIIECGQPRPEHMLAIAEAVVASIRRGYRVAEDYDLLDSQGRFEIETLAPAAGSARACVRLAHVKIAESLRRKLRSTETSEASAQAVQLH